MVLKVDKYSKNLLMCPWLSISSYQYLIHRVTISKDVTFSFSFSSKTFLGSSYLDEIMGLGAIPFGLLDP